jgi:hypothetical protein
MPAQGHGFRGFYASELWMGGQCVQLLFATQHWPSALKHQNPRKQFIAIDITALKMPRARRSL